jgi:hypothetical protein
MDFGGFRLNIAEQGANLVLAAHLRRNLPKPLRANQIRSRLLASFCLKPEIQRFSLSGILV